MSRPVTLFTGQWADLPIETMLTKAKSFGYDGVELACWGDHFEVAKADQAYCDHRRTQLKQQGLQRRHQHLRQHDDGEECHEHCGDALAEPVAHAVVRADDYPVGRHHRATATASSTSLTAITESSGPKISSRANSESRFT